MFIRTHRAWTCNKKLNVSLQFSFTRPSLKFFFMDKNVWRINPSSVHEFPACFYFYDSYLSFNLILNLVEHKLQNG